MFNLDFDVIKNINAIHCFEIFNANYIGYNPIIHYII